MTGFKLEKRLREESPELHRRVTDSMVVLQQMLDSFLTWFPDFTDHSILHSLDVIDFCNQILGDKVEKLTIPECYALIMSCYLHDIGMGVTTQHFREFTKLLDLESYKKEHPDATDASIVRALHHEYSGIFIMKYAELFDIPSEELLFAIVQISRGHRKTDLYDPKEYPDIPTADGVIRTAFLAAVLRLADEIDVAVDRNPELLFDTSKLTQQVDIDAFGIHESIKTVEVLEDTIVLRVRPKEPRFIPLVENLAKKIQDTLDYCRDVAEKRAGIIITQKKVEIKPA